jgi:hypothetical protein
MLGYYFIIYKPNVDKLEWVSNVYDGCIKTSSRLMRNSLYADLQEAINGHHNSDKLNKYLQEMKEFSRRGECQLENSGQCLDVYLYVSRSFLVRGNESDINSARSALEIYRNNKDSNLYYDTVSLAVDIFNGRKIDADLSYYKSAISEVKKYAGNVNYYSLPHDQKSCRILLDHIGATYAKMGEFASDLYITTYLLNF